MVKKSRKILSYIWLTLLVIGCVACNHEARNNTSQTCALNKHSQISVAAERPIVQVVIDDKALAAFTKQKVTAVYCVAMGAS